MRMVIDSNYLRTRELRDWLTASRKNIAVLTDQAELEMAKADTMEGFLKSTEVLAEFGCSLALDQARVGLPVRQQTRAAPPQNEPPFGA
jgi:hypothetical protein